MKPVLLLVSVSILIVALGVLLSSSRISTGVVESSEELMIARPAKILFGGDMMFDRSIREVISKKGDAFVLAPLHDLLRSHDAVVANLEGPITQNPSISVGSAIGSRENYMFTFPLRTTAMLQSEHIGIVNVGNNHSDDFGRDGIATTISALDQAEIKHFGDVGESVAVRSLVTTIRGVRIGFVNYNQFVPQGLAHVLEDISAVRSQTDIVIVYTHWGTEYTKLSSTRIQSLAHELIDAGADAIIGSHPHVVQQKELYHGKWIYYSLGNMVFDQYQEKATQEGLLVSLQIDPDTKRITVTEFPISLKMTGQTMLQSAQ